MTVEKRKLLAKKLAAHSLETVDIKTLEALYYDTTLADYYNFSEEELIEELSDREMVIYEWQWVYKDICKNTTPFSLSKFMTEKEAEANSLVVERYEPSKCIKGFK